jgi:thioredoxin 1
MTQNITAADFDSVVLSSGKPVVVDFWAEWCGPCRMVAPILEQMSTEYSDKITIVKVNVDEENALAAQYGITSIPTMLVFTNGEVTKTIVGAKPKPALVAELGDILN